MKKLVVVLAPLVALAACNGAAPQSGPPAQPSEHASSETASSTTPTTVADLDASAADASATSSPGTSSPSEDAGGGSVVGLLKDPGAGGDPNDPDAPVKVPTVKFKNANVTGLMDVAVVHRVVRQRYGAFRTCLEDAMRDDKKPNGDVVIKLTVDKTGKTSAVSDAGSAIRDKSLIDCVRHVFRGIAFPAFVGSGTLLYTLTFITPPE